MRRPKSHYFVVAVIYLFIHARIHSFVVHSVINYAEAELVHNIKQRGIQYVRVHDLPGYNDTMSFYQP